MTFLGHHMNLHFIDIGSYGVHYMSVDNAINQISIPGQYCQLAKLDLEDAWKHISIHPNRLKALLFIMEYQGVTYVDHYLDDYITVGRQSQLSMVTSSISCSECAMISASL